MRKTFSKDKMAALEFYNESIYKKARFMQVRIEDDLDRAGDAFIIEILRALQFWHKEPRIIMQLCTGESPFIGYRKMGGDRVLKYGKAGAILDTWDKPQTQTFLKNNGLNPKLKPDMNKVIAFAIDAIFPQKRSDYFAFAHLLNNVCDLWGVPKDNRHFFYGDIYVAAENGRWKTNKIPNNEYEEILTSIDREGLKILEYQAACLLKGDNRGFALNSYLRIESGKVIGKKLMKNKSGDFRVQELQIKPLENSHIQYRYLESMRNQALMMHEELVKFGGAHITLLGVGPSCEGEGHIGFCEKDTSPQQSCFIGAINDFDATFHIAGAHAKEFYGFKNMFVTTGDVRMPKFGFITYGPADLMYREAIVIVIATGNLKSSSVAKAIESNYEPRYPLSLTQNCRGTYVLDKTAARELGVEKFPWKFQPRAEKFRKEKKAAEGILSGIIRPSQISEKLKEWGVRGKNNVLFVNPHMDDDFLAMMHLIKEMSRHLNIHACYASLGYTAVYSDYILGLLGVASELGQSEIKSLNPKLKERLLNELVKEGRNPRRVAHLDYETLPYMGEKEKVLRAKILLIDLNQRYDLKADAKKLFRNKFRSKVDILKLREFLAEVEQRKPRCGGMDIELMRFLKTSARFMEAASGLMSLGVSYKNIYWPLDVSFYGSPGRPLAIKQEDINKLKDVIKAVRPRIIVFNGEGFPDYGSHSNTEIGTYIALFELLREKKIKNDLVLFQWAGVWDRIGIDASQISVALTREQLQDFYNSFNFFYPTQAPYAPALNASSALPQPFSQDVIANASKSAQELTALVGVPKDIADILKQGGGILNYKVAKLNDVKMKREFQRKQEELVRSRLSIDISSNAALTGPAPYPQKLNEISATLIRESLAKGAISEKEKGLFGLGDSFRLTTENMLEIVAEFRKEMEQGLQGKESSLAMLPTFVGEVSGKEKGVFLTLDLGGSIFRVLMVYLPGKGKKPKVIIDKYPLKATAYDYTQASAEELFGAIAKNVKIFLSKHEKQIIKFGYKKPLPLGFTFSFSVTQTAIDQAKVEKLAKDFRMTGLKNQDVLQFLRKVIRQEGLGDIIKVVSLNNDAVGTLATKRYRDKNCDVGGIVGTGTNFCYVESTENIRTLTDQQKARYGKKTMVINIESGNFNKMPRNIYDRILDSDSTNKGEHIEEKAVSGLYLGELTRLALTDLINKGLLFKKRLTQKEKNKIAQKGSFRTPSMTKISGDDSASLKGVQAQLEKWGIKSGHISLDDKKVVKEICAIVARRAARITAAVIFAIVTHMDRNIQRYHTVGIDGSLFGKHPFFKKNMEEAMRELSMEAFGDNRCEKISFELTTDGSGVGAAVIAAMAASSAHS
jgi:hexokinase